jgi:hypothetical protein
LGKRAQDEAKAEFAEPFDQIRAADAEIVTVAQLLPESARMRVAKARRSLTGTQHDALDQATQDVLGFIHAVRIRQALDQCRDTLAVSDGHLRLDADQIWRRGRLQF